VVWEDGGGNPASYPIVPGMGNNLAVEVRYGGKQRQPLVDGKGVHREVESERSPMTNSRSEEHEPDTRLTQFGRVSNTRRSPMLFEDCGVNPADR
jgi:hypothetical protein